MIGELTPVQEAPWSSEEVVLKVDNLGKVFKLYPSQTGRVREWLTLGRRTYHSNFSALSDVSFQVRKGEFLGIIGPNGAGKSTLLKIITGVLEPTEGSYWSSGKVLSLLELSGGMDNDLTGRENVVRSAQLLGFPDNYARERMEEIAEFAELGEFFDAPMGIYSSGMRIRLAFSLFAFLDCDILILDEVLAVGDIFFKQKCFARLEELIQKRTAIVLVTHSTGTVMRYCQNVLVLDHGRIAFEGPPDKAIQKFLQLKRGQGVALDPASTYIEDDQFSIFGQPKAAAADRPFDWPQESLFLESPLPEKIRTKGAQLTHLVVCDEKGEPRQVFRQGEKACVYFAYHVQENMGVPIAEWNLTTVQNLLVHSRNSLQQNNASPMKVRAGDQLRFRLLVKLDVAPGNYIFDLNLFTMHPEDYAHVDFSSPRELAEKLVGVSRAKPAGMIEVVNPQQSARNIHVGMCNLEGNLKIQLLGTGEGSTGSQA